MTKHKTTQRHFELFRAECEKWIEIFGLKGWEVHINHDDIDADETRADCSISTSSRYCEIRLNKKWGKDHGVKLTDRQIERYAFHEVCELLLAPLVANAEHRYATKIEILETTHDIIRTLENVLWEE